MLKVIKVALNKNTPKQICPDYNSGYNVMIKLATANTGQVVIGPADVTNGTGFPVDRGPAFQLPKMDYAQLYALSDQAGDFLYALVWQ